MLPDGFRTGINEFQKGFNLEDYEIELQDQKEETGEATIWLDEYSEALVVEVDGRYFKLQLGEDISDEIGMYLQNPDMVAVVSAERLS